MQQDQAILVSIPGIGKRLAERVIFELKEKVAAAGVAAISVAGQPVAESDVVGALQALGYSLPEAREAARHGLNMTAQGASLEERVKAALRVLVKS
jgi:Holliday junction DNA helicase RuvA